MRLKEKEGLKSGSLESCTHAITRPARANDLYVVVCVRRRRQRRLWPSSNSSSSSSPSSFSRFFLILITSTRRGERTDGRRRRGRRTTEADADGRTRSTVSCGMRLKKMPTFHNQTDGIVTTICCHRLLTGAVLLLLSPIPNHIFYFDIVTFNQIL